MKPLNLILLLLVSASISAAEAPMTDGLFFHLDSAAQREARRAASLPPFGNSQPVDFVLDTSTNNSLSFQPVPERRPVFISDGEAAYLKFDGKDDFLLWMRRARSINALKAATIFVLAAPKANAGSFSGLLAMTESGKNDYTSGLNFDFGPVPTKDLSVLNVESAGAPGFRDLLEPGFFNAADRPFADFHLFTVCSQIGKTEVFLDGFKGGQRDRSDSAIGADQISVGARLYSNDGTQPPYAQGFFDGAIAEVLIFDRALSEAE